jgi:SpoVK/Ycf46/Vps4 family AAA+-type ATPase
VVVETPSLISKFIGETGSQLAELFRLARRHAGGVALFFDELDALAAARKEGGGSGGGEKNNIVIALLQLMDRHNGLIFAATNRPDAIDPAIWRRFQLQIEVGLPGATERFAIVKRYIAPFRVSDETISAVSDALAGAAPALIREVAESIKRDLVLGPRLNHDLSPAAMFGRIRVSSSPAREMPTPPLWDEDASDDVLVRLSKAPWPPALETA